MRSPRAMAASLGRAFAPLYWREAALCVPVLPLILVGGVLADGLFAAMVMCGAAFSVGFGAARTLGRRRWMAMIAAALGLAVATFAGSLIGQSFAPSVIVATMLAGICGALALFDEDWWWLVLQVVIAFVVASYYPHDLAGALERGRLVLAGGAAQIGCVWLLAALYPAGAQPLPPGGFRPNPERHLLIGHTLRAMAAVGVSMTVARLIGLSHDYWAPMTALLVLKPGLLDTQTRGIARLIGTLGGTLLATAWAVTVKLDTAAMIGAVSGAALVAYAAQRAHYAVLSGAITMTIVSLVDLALGAPLANADHRIMATLLGGGTAMAFARIASARWGQTPPAKGPGAGP